jgi:hypothetical protein
VDATRPFVVLAPGVYTQSLLFDGKNVTVCGSGATIDAGVAKIVLSHGALVKIRDLKFIEGAIGVLGAGTVISCNPGDLTLDNVEATLGGLLLINGGPAITIRNSRLTNAYMMTSARVIIDRSVFLSYSGIENFGSNQFIEYLEITNSVFASKTNDNVIQINANGDTASSGSALIANNTFAGGSVLCNGASTARKVFESNIFYTSGTLQMSPGCVYNYNLITPTIDVGGMGNTTGDPLFVDPANSDFHLKPGSPAIDAAAPTPSQPNNHDHDGAPRPKGTRSDIGAFEYVP